MTEPEKAHDRTKAHGAGAFVLLSRLLVALFAATVYPAPHARVLAQQPAASKKEAATTQPGTAAAASPRLACPTRRRSATARRACNLRR